MRKVRFFFYFLILLLAVTAEAQPVTGREDSALTICGIRPGMTAEQVSEILGTPVSQGKKYPLRNEEVDIWPIAWWCEYETDYLTREYPAGHLGPHIGFDREGGRVVFVAGPSVEKDGQVLAGPNSDFEALAASLGPRGRYGWSADACYAYYPGGVLVRGCGHVEGTNTFYLRDWEAQITYQNERIRQENEAEWERRTKLPKDRGLTPAGPDRLTMLGIYLGMTLKDLKGAGVPFEGMSSASKGVQHFELGDPRTSDTIRVVLFEQRVVFIDGYRLERNGHVMIRVNDDSREDGERKLGPPSRERSGKLQYADDLLQVDLSKDDTVFFIRLGAQPEYEDYGDNAYWPPRNDSDFKRSEIEAQRRTWP